MLRTSFHTQSKRQDPKTYNFRFVFKVSKLSCRIVKLFSLLAVTGVKSRLSLEFATSLPALWMTVINQHIIMVIRVYIEVTLIYMKADVCTCQFDGENILSFICANKNCNE